MRVGKARQLGHITFEYALPCCTSKGSGMNNRTENQWLAGLSMRGSSMILYFCSTVVYHQSTH